MALSFCLRHLLSFHQCWLFYTAINQFFVVLITININKDIQRYASYRTMLGRQIYTNIYNRCFLNIYFPLQMHEICLDSNIYPNIRPNIYPNITPRNQNRNPNISKHLNQVSLLSDMVLICLGNVWFQNLTHQHITPTSYPTSKRLYYPTSKCLYHLKLTYINIYKCL